MPEVARTTTGNQIWITRGHLAALAVATAAIAVLAFLVGVEVGRAGGPAAPADDAPATAAFLPDASDEEALEALLREVEQAQRQAEKAGPEADVTFNHDLPQAAPPAVPLDPPPSAVMTEVAGDPLTVPPPSPPPGAGAPTDGWAVQIASYEDIAEADAHVARLVEQSLAAYRVAALVSGTTWYRVRVGGFTTREAALEARTGLAAQLGLGDLMVAEAP